MIDLRKPADEPRPVDVVVGPQSPAHLDQAVLRRVIDGDTQPHPRAMRRGLLAALDQLAQVYAQPVATADDIDANRLLQAPPRLRLQMVLEQRKQSADLTRRSLPVGGRKRVEGERADTAARGRFHYGVDCIGAGTMPGRSRQ